MIAHRPYLSMITGLSVLGVISFYTIVCWQNYLNRPTAAQIRSKKAIRARKRKEELARRKEEASLRRIADKEMTVSKYRDSKNLIQRNIRKDAVEEMNKTDNQEPDVEDDSEN